MKSFNKFMLANSNKPFVVFLVCFSFMVVSIAFMIGAYTANMWLTAACIVFYLRMLLMVQFFVKSSDNK